MKQISFFSKQLSVLIVFMACCFTASAYDFMVDSLCYNIIGENEVEVTRNVSFKVRGEVAIPATVIYDNVTYQVTQIGSNAFAGCNQMTLIDIPEGIVKINEWAFDGCSGLEYLEFPNSLVSIARGAFYGCSNVSSINITRNLTDIAYNVFYPFHKVSHYTCSALNPKYRAVDGIIYTKDLTKLVAYPQAAPATSFVVPSTVTILGDYCLHNCDNLTDVTIHDGVTEFGMNIFSYCDNIESIYVPDGVTKMGVTVFGQCSKLSSVHLPASLDTLSNACFYDCDSLRTLTIPRNVKYVGDYCFGESDNLKTVIFEEGSCVGGFGHDVFAECASIEYFDMPNTATTIGKSMFYMCPTLKRVHLSTSLTNIPYGSFFRCYQLTDLDIPGTVTLISNTAIQNCTALKTLKIGDKDAPAGTTLIEHYALAHSEDLERLELGANLDSMTYISLADLGKVKLVVCWATTPPRCNENAMEVRFSTTPLYVPKVAVDAYREATMWNRFQTIGPIEDVGDVNGDGNINISDVTTLINYLLGGESDRLVFADVDLDGSVNITDVASLINRLLNNN